LAHAALTRLVASIGLAFVVIVLVSNVVVLPPPPATGASAADLARFVASNGFRLLLAAFLDAVAVTLFLVFGAGLVRGVMAAAGTLRDIAIGGVLLAVALSYVLDATLVALVVVESSGEAQALPAIAAVLDGILRLFPFTIAAFLGAVAVAALAERSLPGWLGVAAAAITVAAVAIGAIAFLVEGAAGAAFLAFMLMLAWIVLVSVRLLFADAVRPPGSDRAGQVRPESGQGVPGGGDRS
jgi:hypothetical protein